MVWPIHCVKEGKFHVLKQMDWIDPELKWTSVNLICAIWKSCEKNSEAESLVKHRKHCFIDCTGLDWFGLDQGEQDIWWEAGWKGGGGGAG